MYSLKAFTISFLLVDFSTKNDKSAEPIICVGVLYEKDYDFQKAISYYLNSINADGKYHEAYHRLGVCQSKINRYSESISSLKKAIEMHRGELRVIGLPNAM